MANSSTYESRYEIVYSALKCKDFKAVRELRRKEVINSPSLTGFLEKCLSESGFTKKRIVDTTDASKSLIYKIFEGEITE